MEFSSPTHNQHPHGYTHCPWHRHTPTLPSLTKTTQELTIKGHRRAYFRLQTWGLAAQVRKVKRSQTFWKRLTAAIKRHFNFELSSIFAE